MATFLRPGTQKPAAFGLSFDIDRDRDRGGAAPVYNKNEHLAVQEQRRRWGRQRVGGQAGSCRVRCGSSKQLLGF